MTGPRTCRRCGAPLPGEVAWCLRCFEPVRYLTPREKPLPPLADVDEPPPWVRRSPLRDAGPRPVYSRWRAGPTTFGPVGRLLITAIVAAAFPWAVFGGLNPLLLWYTLGYTVAASLVLRHTWRRERVTDPRPGPMARVGTRLAERAPALTRPVDGRIVLGVLGVLAVASVGYAWVQADPVGRYVILAVAVALGLGLFVAWFNEL